MKKKLILKRLMKNKISWKLSFVITIAMVMCFAACEDKYDPIGPDPGTRFLDLNKFSFSFTNNGGSDSLYIKGHQYMNLHSMAIRGSVDTIAFSPYIEFSTHPEHITDFNGQILGNITYDGKLVRSIDTPEYLLNLIYDEKGNPTYTYLVEGKPVNNRLTGINLLCTAEEGRDITLIRIFPQRGEDE